MKPRKIFKYPLKIVDMQVVSFPMGAKILSVKEQSNIPVLYALVDIDADSEDRVIAMFGTGEDCGYPSTDDFIGTVMLMNGTLVLHVFKGELIKEGWFKDSIVKKVVAMDNLTNMEQSKSIIESFMRSDK